MTTERERFDELIGDIWGAFRWLAALPIPAATPQEELERLHDELEIKDHIASYANAYDSKELSRILDHFAEDAVLTSNLGHFVGREEIATMYEPNCKSNRLSFHRIQCLSVKVPSTGSQGWLSAYYHSPSFDGEGHDRSAYGRYFVHLEKLGPSWTIADLRIITDKPINLALS